MPAPPNAKLKVRIGDKELEIEGEPEHVASVIAHLLAQGSPSVVVLPPGSGGLPIATSAPPAIVDIRAFFREKPPTSDNEAAAAVAYYYKFVAPPEDRRDTIDKDTLEEAFRLANWELPSKPLMTLVHAKNAGYLSQADKGVYRLTTVGHNLVAHSLGRTRANPKPTPARKGRRSKPRRARRS